MNYTRAKALEAGLQRAIADCILDAVEGSESSATHLMKYQATMSTFIDQYPSAPGWVVTSVRGYYKGYMSATLATYANSVSQEGIYWVKGLGGARLDTPVLFTTGPVEN